MWFRLIQKERENSNTLYAELLLISCGQEGNRFDVHFKFRVDRWSEPLNLVRLGTSMISGTVISLHETVFRYNFLSLSSFQILASLPKQAAKV